MTTRDVSAAESTATGVEIRQQPDLWNVVASDARVAEVRASLASLLDDPAARIVLSGAGTSAFAGEVLAAHLSRRLGRRVDAVATTDIVADPLSAFADNVPTLLVSLARSGDSPESLAATEIADRLLTSVRHLVVTCNSGGSLARTHAAQPNSEVLLMPAESNDRGFAMTSSFTCMLLATQLVLAPPNSVAADVARLGEAAANVLAAHWGELADLAARRYQRVVYLGSGALTGLAREAALKLLELTAGDVVSYWDSSLGFRHGPKAVLGPGALAVVFVSPDAHTRRYDEDIAAELRETLGAEHVLEVTVHDAADRPTCFVGPLADLPDTLVALPYAVLAQQFALLASLELGHTPDNPFPSGELNRVVQGVRIYPL